MDSGGRVRHATTPSILSVPHSFYVRRTDRKMHLLSPAAVTERALDAFSTRGRRKGARISFRPYGLELYVQFVTSSIGIQPLVLFNCRVQTPQRFNLAHWSKGGCCQTTTFSRGFQGPPRARHLNEPRILGGPSRVRPSVGHFLSGRREHYTCSRRHCWRK